MLALLLAACGSQSAPSVTKVSAAVAPTSSVPSETAIAEAAAVDSACAAAREVGGSVVRLRNLPAVDAMADMDVQGPAWSKDLSADETPPVTLTSHMGGTRPTRPTCHSRSWLSRSTLLASPMKVHRHQRADDRLSPDDHAGRCGARRHGSPSPAPGRESRACAPARSGVTILLLWGAVIEATRL